VEGNEILRGAVKGRRVIKAVYTTDVGGDVSIIHTAFKDKLFKVLVCVGKEKVREKEICELEFNWYGNFCYNMEGNVEYTVYFIFNDELWNSTASMFRLCHNLIYADFRHFNTTNVENMSSMFYSCIALTKLDFSNFDTKSVTDMSHMFYNCSSLTKLDLSKFNTTSVKNMSWMFADCPSLKELNLSKFDTKKVTDMSSMFALCEELKELDLSNFDFSHVVNMKDMFGKCKFDNLSLSKKHANIKKRFWCLGYRYVYIKDKRVVEFNPNKVKLV
jgi:surface protein